MNHLLHTRIIILMASVIFFSSCSNPKQLSYFQDLNDTGRMQQVAMYPYEPLKLQADDQVQISISSTSPESSQYFNLGSATTTSNVAGTIATPSAVLMNVYNVSAKGDITMPVLGDIPVAGLTTEELKEKISDLLKPYLKNAVVAVRLSNFKVTVVGEVGRPTTLPVAGERMNVLEAIGAVGDMTIYGSRYNVKVMHKAGNNMQISHLDFNKSSALKSPYFQLRQNDVVYVEPIKTKGLVGNKVSYVLPIVASAVLIIVSIISLLK
ncbi:MAG: polysaccharide biosynthesis/export family protein [Chitinophagaceae bacterium]